MAHQLLQLLDPRVGAAHEQRPVGVAQDVWVRERRCDAGGEHHRAHDVPERVWGEPAVVDRRAVPVDARAGVGKAPVGALATEPGKQDSRSGEDALALLEPGEQRVGHFRRDR